MWGGCLFIIKGEAMVSNSDNIDECRYIWNDLVVIKKEVPAQFHPGEIGVVCGMSKIKFEDVTEKYYSELGTWFYTVEFGDGSSIELPECYLEPYDNN